MKKARTDKSIEDYKKIKKKIKLKVKSANRDAVSKLLKDRNAKNLWQGVNTICGRKTGQTEDLTLLKSVNGLTTSDNKECADIFANTFESKVSKLIEQVREKDAMTDRIAQKFENIEINIQFNTKDIIDIVGSLCPEKELSFALFIF